MKTPILAFLAAVLLTGCTFETSDNGSLDGFWQLASLDSLHNGRSVDMRQQGYYWAVQHHLLEMRANGSPMIFFRFERTGDKLILSEPVVDNRSIGDSVVTSPELLLPFGLSGLSDTLRVLRLDGEKLTVEGRFTRMYFRKY